MKKQISKIVTALAVGTLFVTFSCKKPAASFTSDKSTAKVGEVVTFTNTSEKDAKAMWDFGDGSQLLSTQDMATHTYAKAGSYNVTLTVTKKNGKKPSAAPAMVITVTENKTPMAMFTSKTNVVAGEIVTFNSTSTEADEIVWDFGDGSMTTNSPIQTHIYNENGMYVVALTAYSNNRMLRNIYTSTITVTGATGNNATQNMLVGKWKMSSHEIKHTYNGATITMTAGCNMPNASFNVYAVSSFTTLGYIEVRSNGSILNYDGNGNLNNGGSGNYDVKSSNMLNSWDHGSLKDNPSTIANFTSISQAYGSNAWDIITLSPTTLSLKYIYTNTNFGTYNGAACTPANTTVYGTQVFTELVTYTKMP